MEEKEKVKYRRIDHHFISRHTILGFVLLLLGSYLLSQTVGLGFELLFRGIIPHYAEQNLVGYGIAFAGPVTMALFWLWFRPEFSGVMRTDGLVRTLALSAWMIPYWTISVVPALLSGGAVFHMVGAQAIGTSLMAGFWEEAAFRGVALSFFMRQWRDEKHILPSLLLSSAAFGLMHGFNALLGANIVMTIIQVVSTTGIGILFGAIFLRGGNLWPLILIHFANDVLALASTDAATENGIITGRATAEDYLGIAICLALAALGFWLVRPSKRAQILALWRSKWNLPQPDNQPETDAQ